MAIVQNTLIGRSKNKVGGTVFTTWKGLNVLKSKPLTVANPRTDGQLAQRSALSQMVNLGRSILNMIRFAFIEVSINRTEWSSFQKYNLNEAFTIAPPLATLNADDMTVSRGTLINPPDIADGAPVGRDITITWTDNSGASGANASDQLQVVTVTDAGEIYGFTDEGARTAGTATITIPGATAIANFFIYAYFNNESLRKASDSTRLN